MRSITPISRPMAYNARSWGPGFPSWYGQATFSYGIPCHSIPSFVSVAFLILRNGDKGKNENQRHHGIQNIWIFQSSSVCTRSWCIFWPVPAADSVRRVGYPEMNSTTRNICLYITPFKKTTCPENTPIPKPFQSRMLNMNMVMSYGGVGLEDARPIEVAMPHGEGTLGREVYDKQDFECIGEIFMRGRNGLTASRSTAFRNHVTHSCSHVKYCGIPRSWGKVSKAVMLLNSTS